MTPYAFGTSDADIDMLEPYTLDIANDVAFFGARFPLTDDEVIALPSDVAQEYFEWYYTVEGTEHHLDYIDEVDYIPTGCEAYDDEIDERYSPLTDDEVSAIFESDPTILTDTESVSRR